MGLYALRMMSDGPIYVHQLATRVADRTQGGWRPSAGAIYPAVRSLVDRGLARSFREGGRKLYRVTPAGRARLRQFLTQSARWRGRFGESRSLLLDFLEPEELVEHLLQHLRRDLRAIRSAVENGEPSLSASERTYLRAQTAVELSHELGYYARARRGGSPAARGPARSRRATTAVEGRDWPGERVPSEVLVRGS